MAVTLILGLCAIGAIGRCRILDSRLDAARCARDSAMETLRFYVEKIEAENESHQADMAEVAAQVDVLLAERDV